MNFYESWLSYKDLPYSVQENIDNLIYYNPDLVIDMLINLDISDIKKLRYIKVFKKLIDSKVFWTRKLKSDFKYDVTNLDHPFELYKEEYIGRKKGLLTTIQYREVIDEVMDAYNKYIKGTVE